MKAKNIFLFIIVTCLLSACGNSTRTLPSVTASTAVAIDTFNSSCPHLTKDEKGRVVLSWVRSYTDTNAIVCYAVSDDSGKTFGSSVEIPCSKNVFPHGENMPKILYKPDGEMIAAWGCSNPNPKNQYSGLVYYSLSFDHGKSWTAARSVSADTASIDERYFDLGLLPDGEAAIVWLDSRTKTDKEGSTLYFATTHGRDGFSGEKPIAATCCQCCRTDLFVDDKGNIHVAFRDIINDSIRDMVHIISTDGGKTFSSPERISKDNWAINGCPHTGPSMTKNNKGLHFAWYTGGKDGGIYFCSADDNGQHFSDRNIVVDKVATKHPQIISLQNNQLVIVWDEVMKNGAQYNSSIGLQLRDEDGHKLLTKYVSPANAIATFPVIIKANGNKALLAYTLKKNGKNNVCYQLLTVQ